jgi:hypothetical protein
LTERVVKRADWFDEHQPPWMQRYRHDSGKTPMAKIILDRHPHPKYPRLTLQRRSNSKYYQAVVFLDGKMRQKSTHTVALSTAFKLGEEWYKREIRASVRFGKQHPIAQLTSDPTMMELFRGYEAELAARQIDLLPCSMRRAALRASRHHHRPVHRHLR